MNTTSPARWPKNRRHRGSASSTSCASTCARSRPQQLARSHPAHHPSDRHRDDEPEREPSEHHDPEGVAPPVGDEGRRHDDGVHDRRREHERHRSARCEPLRREAPGHRHRPAFADGERDTRGRGRRQLEPTGQQRDARERRGGHEHFDRRRDRGAEQDERHRFDQQRAEHDQQVAQPRHARGIGQPHEHGDAHEQGEHPKHRGSRAARGRTVRSGPSVLRPRRPSAVPRERDGERRVHVVEQGFAVRASLASHGVGHSFRRDGAVDEHLAVEEEPVRGHRPGRRESPSAVSTSAASSAASSGASLRSDPVPATTNVASGTRPRTVATIPAVAVSTLDTRPSSTTPSTSVIRSDAEVFRRHDRPGRCGGVPGVARRADHPVAVSGVDVPPVADDAAVGRVGDDRADAGTLIRVVVEVVGERRDHRAGALRSTMPRRRHRRPREPSCR